jgi:hypothetical protein
MNHGVEMTSCGIINIPSQMKIVTGVETMLSLSLRNLKRIMLLIVRIYELRI